MQFPFSLQSDVDTQQQQEAHADVPPDTEGVEDTGCLVGTLWVKSVTEYCLYFSSRIGKRQGCNPSSL